MFHTPQTTVCIKYERNQLRGAISTGICISITLKLTCFCSCFRADKITKLEDCYNLKGIYKQKEHPDADQILTLTTPD